GKAVDTRNPSNVVSTDIYFIEVRPFGREYRQGQQGGGGGGGGDQNESTEALSRRKKEIIAATHKLVNNKDKFKEKEWKDNIHAISTNQSKLAEQTTTVLQRMSRRGLTSQDKTIKQQSENLKNSIDQMNPAADQLKAENAQAAEPFEQKALQYLMRAEALFNEIQVTQGGGGGGGGARQSAEDLADLFELELDQNKNQYETLQRGEMNKGSQAIDEALQKLKELAELSPENNDRQMADVSRALQQAARNMQQQGQGGNSQQQQEAAQQALEQLNRAQRLLNQGRGGSMDDRLAKLQEQAKKLKEQQ